MFVDRAFNQETTEFSSKVHRQLLRGKCITESAEQLNDAPGVKKGTRADCHARRAGMKESLTLDGSGSSSGLGQSYSAM